jgi:hypothetical protein
VVDLRTAADPWPDSDAWPATWRSYARPVATYPCSPCGRPLELPAGTVQGTTLGQSLGYTCWLL